MFLKRIELFGFKSFAEKTTIEFGSGISAVLGPNGCGKSNIVDSLKWVIGEQSTKTLRAAKMEDVIFNGTDERKALNVAEVVLTLSNDGGILPLDMPEISIKRRLYRSGESEYFINRRNARLREIRELFFDTGVGKTAYSLIEQGKVDQILSDRPEDRRTVFEEAAGITKYRIKGREATKKLAQTEENMLRVGGILGEVKRRYLLLKEQAAKTQRYRELSERLFENELDLQLCQLQRQIKKSEGKQRQLSISQGEKSKLQGVIDRINEKMEETIDRVNAMESQLIEIQKKLYGIDLEKNNRDNQVRILKERISEIDKKVEEDSLLKRSVGKRLEDLEVQKTHSDRQLRDLNSELSEIEANIEGFERDITHFTKRISANNKSLDKNAAAIAEIEKKLDQLRQLLREITDDIVTQLDSRLSEKGFSQTDLKRLEQKIEELIVSLSIQWEGKLSILKDMEALGSNDQGQALRSIQATRSMLEDSLKKLERLQELYERYKTSIPSFLEDFLSPQGIITHKREIDRNMAEGKSKADSLKNANHELQENNRGLVGKIDEYRKTLEDLRVHRARLVARADSLKEAIELLDASITEQRDLVEASIRRIFESEKRAGETSERIEALGEEIDQLGDEELELKGTIGRLEAEIGQKNNLLVMEEKRLKEKMSMLLKRQKETDMRQLELAGIKGEIKQIHATFKEKYARDLEEYESRMAEMTTPESAIRDKLNGVRESLKELGHVNLMAPEEYAEVEERYEFLTSQLEDMKKARTDLSRITEEIKNESTDLFLETFRLVKKNFHALFRKLFGGGRAELKLADPSDVLESGIEIYAQPPGKKLESIDLLSGGERALTAVGLLFAIHLTRPAPFCVLDEIDAPLDDSNIERFLRLLHGFSNGTQFIIITHNKRTIAAADTLLGITMEESGISKLVTARLKIDDQQMKPLIREKIAEKT